MTDNALTASEPQEKPMQRRQLITFQEALKYPASAGPRPAS